MSYYLDTTGQIVGFDKNDQSLMHWKYKKKYRGPSGKWIYVYDDYSMSKEGTIIVNKPNHVVNEGDGYKTVTSSKTTYRTNPKRLFSKGTETLTSESSLGKTLYKDTVKKVEYGRLHIEKMNMERRLSTAKKATEETVTSIIHNASKIATKKRKSIETAFDRFKPNRVREIKPRKVKAKMR